MKEIRPGVIAVHWVNDVGATKSKIPSCETPGTASGRQGHGNGRKATHHLRRPGGGSACELLRRVPRVLRRHLRPPGGSMTSIRSLVGLDVLTVDHVRRRIVSVDYEAGTWTDEDDITTPRSAIASVFFNGQPTSVDEAVRRQTPWVEA